MAKETNIMNTYEKTHEYRSGGGRYVPCTAVAVPNTLLDGNDHQHWLSQTAKFGKCRVRTMKRIITPHKGDRSERIEARINTEDKRKLTQYLKSTGVTFADWLVGQIKKIDDLSES